MIIEHWACFTVLSGLGSIELLDIADLQGRIMKPKHFWIQIDVHSTYLYFFPFFFSSQISVYLERESLKKKLRELQAQKSKLCYYWNSFPQLWCVTRVDKRQFSICLSFEFQKVVKVETKSRLNIPIGIENICLLFRCSIHSWQMWTVNKEFPFWNVVICK